MSVRVGVIMVFNVPRSISPIRLMSALRFVSFLGPESISSASVTDVFSYNGGGGVGTIVAGCECMQLFRASRRRCLSSRCTDWFEKNWFFSRDSFSVNVCRARSL